MAQMLLAQADDLGRDVSEWLEKNARDVAQWVEEGYGQLYKCGPPPAPQKHGLFQVGDPVEVWSNSLRRWFRGLVREVLTADGFVGQRRIPAGSVCVVCEQDQIVKWVLPPEMQRCLRQLRAAAPEPPPLESGTMSMSLGGVDILQRLRAEELRCKSEKRRFEDPDFPPTLRDKVTKWCRPGQITSTEGKAPIMGDFWNMLGMSGIDWQLFRGDPCADDIQQGALGDCWFLSSLAALAEFRGGQFARELFPEQIKLSPAGIYMVRLCLGGQWHSILVDDRLPCIGDGAFYHTQLAYCTTRRSQLWASLVEKAYAKACGSYESVIGGEAGEALSVLTGWPCTLVIFSWPGFDAGVLWATLESSKGAGFLMTCSTPPHVRSRTLTPNHVYSLLDVCEVRDAGQSCKLLKIRNPYAKNSWDGAWGDSSSQWTQELRRQLKFPKGGIPGVFFLDLHDFVQHFAHCTICRIREGVWEEVREVVPIPHGDVPRVGLSLEAFETTECSLSLIQPDSRVRQGPLYANLCKPLSSLGYVLVKVDEPENGRRQEGGRPASANLVASVHMRCRGDISEDCWLQPGPSYVLVPLSFNFGSPFEATCACASSRPVVVGKRALSMDIVRVAWAAYARKNARIEEAAGIRLYLASGSGGVVALAENRGAKSATIELTLTGDMMFSRGHGSTSDWLQPGQGQILQVAQPRLGAGALGGWGFRHRFSTSSRGPGWQQHSPALALDDLHVPFLLELVEGEEVRLGRAEASGACAPQ
mmetsp:Transcript_44012/g.141109  ORF Transcript_44012/g.141109 Transcript_44012/m.141109 type:complete len:758 (-) Transcript_44012:132-2405(-)